MQKKYEYMTMHSDNLILEDELTAFGAEGWEFFWVQKIENCAGVYYELLAKREVIDE